MCHVLKVSFLTEIIAPLSRAAITGIPELGVFFLKCLDPAEIAPISFDERERIAFSKTQRNLLYAFLPDSCAGF